MINKFNNVGYYTFLWYNFKKCGFYMPIVEVDKNYRIVLTRDIRKKISIKPGQKIYLLVSGNEIILIPLPENIDEALDKLSGKIVWNRQIREDLEKYLISNLGG